MIIYLFLAAAILSGLLLKEWAGKRQRRKERLTAALTRTTPLALPHEQVGTRYIGESWSRPHFNGGEEYY